MTTIAEHDTRVTVGIDTHGETDVAAVLDDGLRIEVADTGSADPALRVPDAVGGRGLGIVATVAEIWGVRQRLGDGKTVFTCLPNVNGAD